jgi:1,2-diacylglycerol 3-alpha-glucosyltransferase
MKPLHILMAGQVYSDGNGQGGFTLRLAENLASRGHRVAMLMPSDQMKSYSTTVNGVEVEKIAAVHMSIIHPAVYITPISAPRVKKIFEDFSPDIVHIQDHYFLSKAVAREARRRGIPMIGTNHFLPENMLPFLVKYPQLCDLAGRVLWAMMLGIFNKLNAATTPSHAGAEILRRQGIQVPVHAISNGIDTARFSFNPNIDREEIRRKYGLAHEKTIFLYVGRLDGEKRVDVLVEAASQLPQKNFQLAIVGRGLQGEALRRQVQRLGLKDDVIFLGYIPAEDLPSLYVSADVFVMPGSAELQSIATMEALACSTPVLAANARALPELVVHGVTGYLFEANNAADAAYWMEKFIAAPAQRTKMGQAGVLRLQSHSLANTVKSYEDCYRTFLGKNTQIQRSFVFKVFDFSHLKKVFRF